MQLQMQYCLMQSRQLSTPLLVSEIEGVATIHADSTAFLPGHYVSLPCMSGSSELDAKQSTWVHCLSSAVPD